MFRNPRRRGGQLHVIGSNYHLVGIGAVRTPRRTVEVGGRDQDALEDRLVEGSRGGYGKSSRSSLGND